jgi:hypothetical protein
VVDLGQLGHRRQDSARGCGDVGVMC